MQSEYILSLAVTSLSPQKSTATGIARNRGSTLYKEVVLAQPLQAGNAGFYTMIFFHGIMGLALGRQKYEKNSEMQNLLNKFCISLKYSNKLTLLSPPTTDRDIKTDNTIVSRDYWQPNSVFFLLMSSPNEVMSFCKLAFSSAESSS